MTALEGAKEQLMEIASVLRGNAWRCGEAIQGDAPVVRDRRHIRLGKAFAYNHAAEMLEGLYK